MTGEHLSPDVRELLRLLDRHRVRFLVVGGEAVIHHGYPRLTGDIDLFVERTATNMRRLYDALREFWEGEVPAVASAEELLEPDLVVQFGRPPNRIDLFNQLGRVVFAAAWRRRIRERLHISKSRSIPLPIIGLEDLLASKREAGRHKDLDDVEHLTRVLQAKRRRRR